MRWEGITHKALTLWRSTGWWLLRLALVVSLTHPGHGSWEEGTSIGGPPLSDWPGGVSVRHFLDWDGPSHCGWCLMWADSPGWGAREQALSSVPSWSLLQLWPPYSCLELLSRLPSVMDCVRCNRPFLLQVGFSQSVLSQQQRNKPEEQCSNEWRDSASKWQASL